MKKYIRFYGDAGYCGTDYEEIMIFEDPTEDELEREAWDICVDNALMYDLGEYVDPDDFETDEEYEEAYAEAEEEYLSHCSCGWEETTEDAYLASLG